MLDDGKRLHEVSIRLTEREFMALSRLASAREEAPGLYARKWLRELMFGRVVESPTEFQDSRSAYEGLK